MPSLLTVLNLEGEASLNEPPAHPEASGEVLQELAVLEDTSIMFLARFEEDSAKPAK